MSFDLDNEKVQGYEVLFDGKPLGLCDDPEAAIQLVLSERKVGGQPVGDFIIGVGGTVKLKLREYTEDNILLAFPWAGETGALMPEALGGDIYQYAKSLVLHPSDAEDDDDDENDITLAKAVCVKPPPIRGDLAKAAVLELEFKLYPDRSFLPKWVIGWRGPAQELPEEEEPPAPPAP